MFVLSCLFISIFLIVSQDCFKERKLQTAIKFALMLNSLLKCLICKTNILKGRGGGGEVYSTLCKMVIEYIIEEWLSNGYFERLN